MNCHYCGAGSGPSGAGHHCQPALTAFVWSAPAGRVGTWVVVALAAAAGCVSLVSLVLLSLTISRSAMAVEVLFAALRLVLMVALLIAYFVWVRRSKRLVRQHGGNPIRDMPQWALAPWLVALVVGYHDVLGIGGPGSRSERLVLGSQTVAMVLLIAGVLFVRSRIVSLVSRSMPPSAGPWAAGPWAAAPPSGVAWTGGPATGGPATGGPATGVPPTGDASAGR